MKNTNNTITDSDSQKRRGWRPLWLLAFLVALPSCFEISCIKLVGCELLSNDGVDDYLQEDLTTEGLRTGDTPGEISILGTHALTDFVLD